MTAQLKTSMDLRTKVELASSEEYLDYNILDMPRNFVKDILYVLHKKRIILDFSIDSHFDMTTCYVP